MKLYNVPRNTLVRVIEQEVPPPGALAIDVGQCVLFKHVDGMYSYCLTETNEVVHLKAWTEVEIVK